MSSELVSGAYTIAILTRSARSAFRGYDSVLIRAQFDSSLYEWDQALTSSLKLDTQYSIELYRAMLYKSNTAHIVAYN